MEKATSFYANADISIVMFSTKYDDDVLWERKAKLFDVYFRSILP